MNESILTSVKKGLGIAEDYTVFDQDILTCINSIFMVLNQLGIGTDDCFKIEDSSTEWNSFLEDQTNFEAVKSYMILRTRLLFDPPTSSTIMEAFKQSIDELEWRLNINAEY